jgi:hypothetical protein
MNWSSNAIIGKVAPLLLQELGAYTYAIFAILCALMTAYSMFYVPETQGLSLEAMESLFVPQHAVISATSVPEGESFDQTHGNRASLAEESPPPVDDNTSIVSSALT